MRSKTCYGIQTHNNVEINMSLFADAGNSNKQVSIAVINSNAIMDGYTESSEFCR